MSRFILLMMVIAVGGGLARAEETAQLRYHVLTRHMSAFDDLSPEQRDKVRLMVRVVADKRALQPVRLWMLYDGQRTELPVDDHGFVQVPRSPEIVAADPWIETNQPKGRFETKLAMLLLLPDRQHFHYADLRAATAQTDALIDRAAGLASFLAPSVKGVQFRCASADDCSLVLHHPTGDEVLHPNSDGKIRLRLSRQLDAENPLIDAPFPLAIVEPLLD